MPSQATSTTTVLIIPLILNTLFAPAPQTWAPMANAPEIVYQIADLPHHNHSSQDPSAGHPSWIPPVDICRVHFGIANTSDSSVLLLLLVSLPNQQGQPVRSQYGINTTKVSNSTAPWTSLPLEPGIYGVPNKASEEHSISYPFGLNISLDVGSFSLSNSTLLPMSPMIEIEDREISDHPVGAPALFGLVLCSSDGNGSFIPSIYQDGRRYTREVLPRYRKRRTSAAQPRKLLSADNRTNLHNNQHLLVSKKNIVIVAAAAIATGSALLALLICCTVGLRMRMSSEDEMPIQQADLCPLGPRRYSHHELVAAAHGFAEERKIGRGGFGPVYRGFLADQVRHVAIKAMSEGSSVQAQGIREFQAEVKVMTRLRHRNIVQLLGWCDDHRGLMLVYEFVPDGSLGKHLYDSHRLLAWSDRYKIALGVGSAILYLHTECEQCVLHGDIKPANILLDHSCNAKLGDFGLARLVDHGTDLCTTQVVAGTPGYIDPEFVNSQRPCIESDIFSFGIVLLEIACGRRPTTRTNGAPVLLNWVRDMYNKNSILGVADQRLHGEFDHQQMRRVLIAGLWCTHHEQSQRPSISQAMDLLRREDAELPVLDPLTHSPDAVRSLEEIAYGDLSAEDSVLENSSTDTTAYHTSTDSSRLLE